MQLLGWRSANHVLFLAPERQEPEEAEGKNGGKNSDGNTGYANEYKDNRGSNSLSPRGEGGEGRVRNW
jgi:hypothetical protein